MFHSFSIPKAFEELRSSPAGLGEEEARDRLARHGPNSLLQKRRQSTLLLITKQFTDLLIIILGLAAIISGFLGEWIDAYAILAIILLNGAIGFLHEYKAEKALEALKKMAAPRARVVRGGSEVRIEANELVPGDVVLLEEGDRVPSDGRLLETISLEADEAALTGESMPVRKDALPILDVNQPLHERDNMIFLGTIITRGRGRALVTATGMRTELGKIAKMVAEEPDHTTPLQKKLHVLGRQISVAAIIVVILVFILGLLHGFPPFEMFLVAVSLAVAAIPEGLPAVVTITLAIGVQRMARKHAIIRKLPAVETLGAATVICTDKTGTLTKNELTAREVYLDGRLVRVTGEGYAAEGSFVDAISGRPVLPLHSPDFRELLHTAALCNNSTLRADPDTGTTVILGDPTEVSLLVLVDKAGFQHESLKTAYPFVQELPFDSARKMMTVVRMVEGQNRAYVKGAPEVLVSRCTRIIRNGVPEELREHGRQEILNKNRQMASQALRVLGFAYRDLSKMADDEHIEEDLVFLGLIGMMDPPRAEVKAAIQACRNAGIRVVMITGDNPVTAAAIGRELGLLNLPDGGIMTGAELDACSDDRLQDLVEKTIIYARVSPEHKLRIVDALKSHGEIVAMTGDGVNDAPAIKRSDIGVAMGLTGTDVTKEASDMIISDDNFASIEHAVEEGRVIYENIMKSVKYLISCNIGELIAILLAIMAGLRSPLTPIQILWMNIVTDSPPAIALAMDPPGRDIMKRPPYNPRDKILNRKISVEMVFTGLLVGLGTLGVFVWYTNSGPIGGLKAGTMAFSVIILFQKFYALAVSGSGERSIIESGVFRNHWLWLAIAFGVLSQILITEWTPVQTIFSTVSLSVLDWVVVIAISSTAFFIPEGIKMLRIRRRKGVGLPVDRRPNEAGD